MENTWKRMIPSREIVTAGNGAVRSTFELGLKYASTITARAGGEDSQRERSPRAVLVSSTPGSHNVACLLCTWSHTSWRNALCKTFLHKTHIKEKEVNQREKFIYDNKKSGPLLKIHTQENSDPIPRPVFSTYNPSFYIKFQSLKWDSSLPWKILSWVDWQIWERMMKKSMSRKHVLFH